MNKFYLIDIIRGTSICKEFKKIKQEYCQNSNALRKTQKEKLSDLLIQLKNNNYFGQFIDNSISNIKSNPEKCLQSIKFTDKSKISKEFQKIKNNSIKQIEYTYTGGSTGNPFKYIVDKKSISRSRAFNYYLWNKYLNYNLGDQIILVSGSSLGKTLNLKNKFYAFLQNKNIVSGDIINEKATNIFIRYINESKKGVFIYGYPSSLIEYSKKINQSLIKTKNIKGIITTSETLLDHNKKKLEDFFNTKVLNVYGANDGGIMSGSINNIDFEYNGLDCYVESVIINDTKELLLTNLNAKAFPFVRYRVGDCASVRNNGVFSLFNLNGRTRHFLVNINQERIHGSLLNKIIKDFPEIYKYQMIQNSDMSCKFYIWTDSKTFNTLQLKKNIYNKMNII